MQPTEAQLQAQKARNIAIQDSLARVDRERAEAVKAQLQQASSQENDTTSKEVSDSLKNNKLFDAYGVFANAAQGEQEYYIIENDLIKIKVSSKGGRIVAAFIKNYDTFDTLPVNLIDEQRSRFNFTFFVQNRNIKTEDLYFLADDKRDINVTGEKKSLSVKAKVADNKYIEYIYTLKPNTYYLDYSIKFVGLNKDIASNIGDIPLDWQADIPKQEKSAKNENTYSNLYFKVKQEDVDYLSETSVLMPNLHRNQFGNRTLLILKQCTQILQFLLRAIRLNNLTLCSFLDQQNFHYYKNIVKKNIPVLMSIYH